GTLRSLPHEDLVPFTLLEEPLRPHGEGVLLHPNVDGGWIRSGKVEVDEDGVASPIGVHRDGRGLVSHRTRELLGQPVDVSKRVKAHDHTTTSSRRELGRAAVS